MAFLTVKRTPYDQGPRFGAIIRPLAIILLAFLVPVLGPASGWTQAASFQGLGFLPGGVNSFGLDVSGDGIVIVGKGNNATVPDRAFRWTTATGLQDLGTL